MEENKDFQKADDEQFENDSPNFDELINSITDSEPSVQNVETEPEKPKFEGYKTNTFLFHFLCIFGVVFISIFFIFNIYLSPITVVGQSMLPTINASTISNSDKTHNDMVYYREKESYTYGDVVIISNESEHYITNTTTNSVEFLIKRVIACPGDTITFFFTEKDEQNHLYYYDIVVKNSKGEVVNLDEESYIKESMYIYCDPTKQIIFNDFFVNIGPFIINDHATDPELRKATITISPNCYFVMGDNRNNSSDSRSFGEVMIEDICGSVRIHVKYGETIWASLFRKLKSHLSVTHNFIKEII